MGTCFSCLEKNESKTPLITNKYCYQCKTMFISNYEYNKHIPNFPKIYEDL